MRIAKDSRLAACVPRLAALLRTNSPISYATRAAGLVAIGLFSANVAMGANVLVNPGAETGDSTGWYFDAKAAVASTNGYEWNAGVNYPPSASNILVHSGEYAFKSYQDAGLASTLIYQDIAAAAGSQWTAECYALSHTQDYIANGNYTVMQVTFYDVNTNSLATYGSVVLDPAAPFFPWTVAPPMALTMADWTHLTANEQYNTDNDAEANYNAPYSGNMVAPPGTAWVRYKLQYEDTSGGGGSMFWDDCVLDEVVASDPDITTPPAGQIVVVGQNATLSVVGTGNTTLFYQWKKGTANASGARFSGTTTASMTISNCFATDAGSYSVVITDTHGSIQSVPVQLTVLNPAAGANALGPNAGFENAPTWSPWNPFNGTGLPSTNSTYYQVTNLVNVYDGKYCAQIYAGGTDNGWWTHVACTPGSVWKAAGHVYITSTVDNFAGSNTCRLQVWFQDANNVHIGPTYESFKIFGLGYSNTYTMLPRDTWVYLPVTNQVDGTTDVPTNYVQNFVAPDGATVINYQVYYYHPAGNPGGSTFWDDMELYQLFPATNIQVTVSGANVNVSFPSRGGSLYSLEYKNNITDPWQVLTSGVPGNGSILTIPDTRQSKRFYRVQTY